MVQKAKRAIRGLGIAPGGHSSDVAVTVMLRWGDSPDVDMPIQGVTYQKEATYGNDQDHS